MGVSLSIYLGCYHVIDTRWGGGGSVCGYSCSYHVIDTSLVGVTVKIFEYLPFCRYLLGGGGGSLSIYVGAYHFVGTVPAWWGSLPRYLSTYHFVPVGWRGGGHCQDIWVPSTTYHFVGTSLVGVTVKVFV